MVELIGYIENITDFEYMHLLVINNNEFLIRYIGSVFVSNYTNFYEIDSILI